MEEEEARARSVLEVARLQARARHLKVRVKLIRTRNPGAAIVEEARDRHSDLVYIGTEHAENGERLLGPTTRYVLANRPCRIVVEGGNAPSLDGKPRLRKGTPPGSLAPVPAPRHAGGGA
jgi:nucleotide-binding universal stress UspA family protein